MFINEKIKFTILKNNQTMQHFTVTLFSIIFILSCSPKTTKVVDDSMSKTKNEMKSTNIEINYPLTRKDEVVEDYHGTSVSDPYRWLEDDTSEETTSWVTAQNKVTQSYLSHISFREDIKKRLTELWDYEKVGTPFKEGDYYYFYRNSGLQNQSVLYRSKEIGGESQVVLDPNVLSEDGTSSLGGISFNSDGSLMAFSVSEGGSDWRTAYVMDLKTLEKLDDKIEWIKFSGLSWQGDGFYYSRYPAPNPDDELSGQNKFHKLYYHALGTDQGKDRLAMESKDHPSRNFYAATSEDERYTFVSVVESTSGNALYAFDSKNNNEEPVELVSAFDSDHSVVDAEGDRLLIVTNLNAPNQKIVEVNMKNPSSNNWKDVIPESNDKLESVSIVGGKMFVKYIHNAQAKIKVYTPEGEFIQDLELPGIGNTGGVSGKKKDDQGFFSFTSYTYPTTSFSLNTKTLEYQVYNRPDVKFNTEDFVTEQIWFESKDGTKVPMFVTHKKGIKLDGSNPTLLYGYGGFNISLLPGFRLTQIPLLENGGIFVVVNLRGGGEFGSKWHKAGTLERKQNVFDDFQYAAEYLIDKGYTSSNKLAIEGGSNGGLLVGACMTQRPDLYQVAFPAVGVLDMLRYHKFTIGWAWATDYGKSDDPEAFDYLIKYSPLHNVKGVKYPSTMVTTADHDDRVVPAHSFKFISELQDKHTGENPVLIRIETSAGHGAGKPTDKIIQENADKLGFMLFNMGETYNLPTM